MASKRKSDAISELVITPNDVKNDSSKKAKKKKAATTPSLDDHGVAIHPKSMLRCVVDTLKKEKFKGVRSSCDMSAQENEDMACSTLEKVIESVEGHDVFDRDGNSNPAKRNVAHRLMGYMFGDVSRQPLPDFVVKKTRNTHPSAKCTGFKEN